MSNIEETRRLLRSDKVTERSKGKLKCEEIIRLAKTEICGTVGEWTEMIFAAVDYELKEFEKKSKTSYKLSSSFLSKLVKTAIQLDKFLPKRSYELSKHILVMLTDIEVPLANKIEHGMMLLEILNPRLTNTMKFDFYQEIFLYLKSIMIEKKQIVDPINLKILKKLCHCMCSDQSRSHNIVISIIYWGESHIYPLLIEDPIAQSQVSQAFAQCFTYLIGYNYVNDFENILQVVTTIIPIFIRQLVSSPHRDNQRDPYVKFFLTYINLAIQSQLGTNNEFLLPFVDPLIPHLNTLMSTLTCADFVSSVVVTSHTSHGVKVTKEYCADILQDSKVRNYFELTAQVCYLDQMQTKLCTLSSSESIMSLSLSFYNEDTMDSTSNPRRVGEANANTLGVDLLFRRIIEICGNINSCSPQDKYVLEGLLLIVICLTDLLIEPHRANLTSCSGPASNQNACFWVGKHCLDSLNVLQQLLNVWITKFSDDQIHSNIIFAVIGYLRISNHIFTSTFLHEALKLKIKSVIIEISAHLVRNTHSWTRFHVFKEKSLISTLVDYFNVLFSSSVLDSSELWLVQHDLWMNLSHFSIFHSVENSSYIRLIITLLSLDNFICPNALIGALLKQHSNSDNANNGNDNISIQINFDCIEECNTLSHSTPRTNNNSSPRAQASINSDNINSSSYDCNSQESEVSKSKFCVTHSFDILTLWLRGRLETVNSMKLYSFDSIIRQCLDIASFISTFHSKIYYANTSNLDFIDFLDFFVADNDNNYIFGVGSNFMESSYVDLIFGAHVNSSHENSMLMKSATLQLALLSGYVPLSVCEKWQAWSCEPTSYSFQLFHSLVVDTVDRIYAGSSVNDNSREIPTQVQAFSVTIISANISLITSLLQCMNRDDEGGRSHHSDILIKYVRNHWLLLSASLKSLSSYSENIKYEQLAIVLDLILIELKRFTSIPNILIYQYVESNLQEECTSTAFEILKYCRDACLPESYTENCNRKSQPTNINSTGNGLFLPLARSQSLGRSVSLTSEDDGVDDFMDNDDGVTTDSGLSGIGAGGTDRFHSVPLTFNFHRNKCLVSLSSIIVVLSYAETTDQKNTRFDNILKIFSHFRPRTARNEMSLSCPPQMLLSITNSLSIHISPHSSSVQNLFKFWNWDTHYGCHGIASMLQCCLNILNRTWRNYAIDAMSPSLLHTKNIILEIVWGHYKSIKQYFHLFWFIRVNQCKCIKLLVDLKWLNSDHMEEAKAIVLDYFVDIDIRVRLSTQYLLSSLLAQLSNHSLIYSTLLGNAGVHLVSPSFHGLRDEFIDNPWLIASTLKVLSFMAGHSNQVTSQFLCDSFNMIASRVQKSSQIKKLENSNQSKRFAIVDYYRFYCKILDALGHTLGYKSRQLLLDDYSNRIFKSWFDTTFASTHEDNFENLSLKDLPFFEKHSISAESPELLLGRGELLIPLICQLQNPRLRWEMILQFAKDVNFGSSDDSVARLLILFIPNIRAHEIYVDVYSRRNKSILNSASDLLVQLSPSIHKFLRNVILIEGDLARHTSSRISDIVLQVFMTTSSFSSVEYTIGDEYFSFYEVCFEEILQRICDMEEFTKEVRVGFGHRITIGNLLNTCNLTEIITTLRTRLIDTNSHLICLQIIASINVVVKYLSDTENVWLHATLLWDTLHDCVSSKLNNTLTKILTHVCTSLRGLSIVVRCLNPLVCVQKINPTKLSPKLKHRASSTSDNPILQYRLYSLLNMIMSNVALLCATTIETANDYFPRNSNNLREQNLIFLHLVYGIVIKVDTDEKHYSRKMLTESLEKLLDQLIQIKSNHPILFNDFTLNISSELLLLLPITMQLSLSGMTKNRSAIDYLHGFLVTIDCNNHHSGVLLKNERMWVETTCVLEKFNAIADELDGTYRPIALSRLCSNLVLILNIFNNNCTSAWIPKGSSNSTTSLTCRAIIQLLGLVDAPSVFLLDHDAMPIKSGSSLASSCVGSVETLHRSILGQLYLNFIGHNSLSKFAINTMKLLGQLEQLDIMTFMERDDVYLAEMIYDFFKIGPIKTEMSLGLAGRSTAAYTRKHCPLLSSEILWDIENKTYGDWITTWVHSTINNYFVSDKILPSNSSAKVNVNAPNSTLPHIHSAVDRQVPHSFIFSFVDISSQSPELAELLFPWIVFELASCDLKYNKTLSVKFNTLLSTSNLPMKRLTQLLCHTLVFLQRQQFRTAISQRTEVDGATGKAPSNKKVRLSTSSNQTTTIINPHSFLLDIDRNVAAVAAASCGLSCISLSFLESSLDSFTTLKKECDPYLLINLYKTLHDPDAVFGVKGVNLELQAIQYSHSGKWAEALSTWEAVLSNPISGSQSQFQRGNNGANPQIGIAEALHGLGYSHVNQAWSDYSSSFQSTGGYIAHNLSQWSRELSPSPKLHSHRTVISMNNLQQLMERVNLAYLTKQLQQITSLECTADTSKSLSNLTNVVINNLIQSSSEESAINIIACVSQCNILHEARDLRQQFKSADNQVSMICLDSVNSLEHRYNQSNNAAVVSIRTRRILHMIKTKALSLIHGCRILNLINAANQTSEAFYSRKSFILRELSKSSENFEKFIVELSLRLHEGKALWALHQQAVAQSLLDDEVIPQLSQQIENLRNFAIDVDSACLSPSWERGCESTGQRQQKNAQYSAMSNLLSEALLCRGEWAISNKGAYSSTIGADYLQPAKQYSTDVASKIKACKALADFNAWLFRSTKARVETREWQQADKVRAVRKAEFERSFAVLQKETTTLKNSNTKPGDVSEEFKALRQHVHTLKKEIEIDEKEKRKMSDTINQYLKDALSNSMEVLIHSPETDLDYVVQAVNLWLGSCHQAEVNNIFETLSAKVSTYKFIPVAYQIFARLGDSKSQTLPDAQPLSTNQNLTEVEFQNQLKKLMHQMCIDHPHHTLWPLFALANGDKVNLSTYKSNMSAQRCEFAKCLIKKLKTSDETSIQKLVDSTEKLLESYLSLANANMEKFIKTGKLRQISFRELCDRSSRPFNDLSYLSVIPHIPTLPIPVRKDCNYSTDVIRIQKISSTFSITETGISRPKMIDCEGTDGIVYRQLLKSGDDTRQDAVMQQVFELVNYIFNRQESTRIRRLSIRTYKIVPLTPQTGIIQWVDNTIQFGAYLTADNDGGAHSRYHPGDWTHLEAREYMKNVSTDKDSSMDHKQRLLTIFSNFKPAFHYFFTENYPDPAVWISRRMAYTRSVAATSIVGYILGIGDRHSFNILLNTQSGEVIHIDFGIVFDQGKGLLTPETVPFRLTRDIVDGMGISGVEGTFRRCCEAILQVLRENTVPLLTILDVVIHDPLYKWSLSPVDARTRQGGSTMQLKDETFAVETTTATRGRFGRDAGERTLLKIKSKLLGFEDPTGDALGVEGHVDCLINEARSVDNLCKLYPGWAPWL